jgi:hypothetical protein
MNHNSFLPKIPFSVKQKNPGPTKNKYNTAIK